MISHVNALANVKIHYLMFLLFFDKCMKHLPNNVIVHFSKRLSTNNIKIFDFLEIKHIHFSCFMGK